MTKQEIQALIAKGIAGQGSAIDVGGVLPAILNGILDLASAGSQGVAELKEVVGDENSGLVKEVGSLSATVGDEDSGLVADMAEAQGELEKVSPLVVEITEEFVAGLAETTEKRTNAFTQCAALKQNNRTYPVVEIGETEIAAFEARISQVLSTEDEVFVDRKTPFFGEAIFEYDSSGPSTTLESYELLVVVKTQGGKYYIVNLAL